MPIEGIDFWLSLAQLPGLNVIESKIAKSWLAKHRDDYERVVFNMRLGAGVQLPPGTPDYILKAAKAGTTKRTDIVAFSNGSVTIVEAKEQATFGALGQLLGYRRLYLQDNPQTGHVDMVIAAITQVADTAHVFAENNIKVELFPNASL